MPAPSYVIVWENNTFGHHKATRSHTWAGHSSMNIGSRFEADRDGDGPSETYVSFWPGTTTSFGVRAVMRSATTDASYKSLFTSDLVMERYLPDHFIELPHTEQAELQMQAAWREIRMTQGGAKYRNLRNNCSTIVSRILHAAGLCAHKWAVDHNFAWSPSDIKDLAIRAGGRQLKWDEVLAVLGDSGITEQRIKDVLPPGQYNARSGVYSSTGASVKFQQGGVRD